MTALPRDPRDIGLRQPERESRRLAEAAEEARLGGYTRGGAASGEAGPEGPEGPEGPAGPPGEAGAPGETDIVYHGVEAGKARPEVSGPVIWIGTVKPANAEEQDLWLNTTPAVAGATVDWGIVEALPEEAIEGDRCSYKAAAGVFWELIYTGEETYPWAKIGGPPLFAEVTGENNTSSTSFTTLSSPSLTTPLAGDYDITVGCRVWNSTAGGYGYFSPKIGAAATADDDGVKEIGGNSVGVGGTRRKRKTGIAASTTIQTQCRANTGTSYFNSRWITLDPVRVG